MREGDTGYSLKGVEVVIVGNTFGHGYDQGEVVTIASDNTRGVYKGKRRDGMRTGPFLAKSDFVVKEMNNKHASRFLEK